MADHPPAKARALVQDAKAGRRPVSELLGEARAIADASFVAEALAALAEDPRLDVVTAGRALTDAASALNKAERAFRKAEAGAEVARRAARWRPGDPEAAAYRAKAYATLANLAQSLHGKDLATLAVAVAKVAPEHRAALLRLVLHHGADPIEDAKAILATGNGPGVAESLVEAPAEAQGRLLAYHRAHGGEVDLGSSLDAAAALPSPARRDALRAIIAAAPLADLPAIHAKLPAEPGERGRLLCALAAQADKRGDPGRAKAWFEEATANASQLPAGKERDAVLRNVEAGWARLAGAAPPPARTPTAPVAEPVPAAAPAAAQPPSEPARPVEDAEARPRAMAGARHVLALVDAYEGRLGDAHFRALGRAAPLCWAFGLDLGLVGFPGDAASIVRAAGQSTGIGEGGQYLEKLAAAGRVHRMPESPTASAGFLVATTPKPDPKKAADFAQALAKAKAQAGKASLVVLVGLGPKGLPGEWMKAAPVHLELTGDNVSLETATAMGIIAERMRQLPLPA